MGVVRCRRERVDSCACRHSRDTADLNALSNLPRRYGSAAVATRGLGLGDHDADAFHAVQRLAHLEPAGATVQIDCAPRQPEYLGAPQPEREFDEEACLEPVAVQATQQARRSVRLERLSSGPSRGVWIEASTSCWAAKSTSS